MRIEEKSLRSASQSSRVVLLFLFLLCVCLFVFFLQVLKKLLLSIEQYNVYIFLEYYWISSVQFHCKKFGQFVLHTFLFIHSGINSQAATLYSEVMPVGHEELTGRLETLRNSEIRRLQVVSLGIVERAKRLSCVVWFARALAFLSLYYPWGQMGDYS